MSELENLSLEGLRHEGYDVVGSYGGGLIMAKDEKRILVMQHGKDEVYITFHYSLRRRIEKDDDRDSAP